MMTMTAIMAETIMEIITVITETAAETIMKCREEDTAATVMVVMETITTRKKVVIMKIIIEEGITVKMKYGKMLVLLNKKSPGRGFFCSGELRYLLLFLKFV
jgi:hypothetical protein